MGWLRFIGLGPCALAVLLVTAACDSDPGETHTTTSSSGGTGGTALPTPEPLTIVTWNVRNFVNAVEDSDATMETVDPGWVSHRGAVGAVLRSIDADVLVLQEVEHEAVLNELNDEELDGDYDHIRVIDANDPRGIDVGVMSKIALDQVTTHQDEQFPELSDPNGPTYRYARDCLEMHLTFNGRPLALLGVHYKAKQNDDPQKRLAEAQHTRGIADDITAAAPSTGILVLGDFNDLPDSPAYLATVGDEPDLYRNAADAVAQADRWTFEYQGAHELVDQQMANGLLHDRLDGPSVRILHSPEAEAASDHAPLIATYLVN
ncbi:MAG: endonuclease/exonuclease/phosphatase family protein [Deltaproteobacteria bacterium]|nr:endonuclease/exonuclease/phosphatase family protein [Deltaproteobacteria bacterium]